MAIYKKKVASDTTAGIIRLHKQHIGEEVYVVTGSHIDRFIELMENAYLFNKVSWIDRTEIKDDFKRFKAEVLSRVARLEEIVYRDGSVKDKA